MILIHIQFTCFTYFALLIFLLSGLFNKDTWSSTDGDESLISSDLIDFLLLRVLGIFTLALSPDFVLGLKFFLRF